MTDQEREEAISAVAVKLKETGHHLYFEKLMALVRGRSPEQIAKIDADIMAKVGL